MVKNSSQKLTIWSCFRILNVYSYEKCYQREYSVCIKLFLSSDLQYKNQNTIFFQNNLGNVILYPFSEAMSYIQLYISVTVCILSSVPLRSWLIDIFKNIVYNKNHCLRHTALCASWQHKVMYAPFQHHIELFHHVKEALNGPLSTVSSPWHPTICFLFISFQIFWNVRLMQSDHM